MIFVTVSSDTIRSQFYIYVFVESTTVYNPCCCCVPKPVIPCNICAQGAYKIHTHNIQDHSAEIHWVDSSYEVAYDIYVNGKFTARVPEDTTRYTLKDLQSGTTYSVQLSQIIAMMVEQRNQLSLRLQTRLVGCCRCIG